jgi:hypothetical protein
LPKNITCIREKQMADVGSIEIFEWACGAVKNEDRIEDTGAEKVRPGV